MKNKETYQLILVQAFFWLVFFLFLFLSEYKYVDFWQNGIDKIIYTIFICGLVYLNTLYLIPNFFFKKKYLSYFLSIILVTFLASYVYSNIESIIFEVPSIEYELFKKDLLFHLDFIYPLIEFTILVGAISSILIAFQQIKIREQLINTEKERVSSQLELLKSQTNPHFLFNVLNSLNFLIFKNQEKASGVVIKLSDLLRYQLYETDSNMVSLQKELNHINNYIDLELMRIGENLSYSSNLKEQFINIEIPPFLLLPLVENSFKHSANISDRFIDFSLKVSSSELIFTTKNSIGKSLEKSSGGLGLKNLRKRLQLLYPQKHTFDIEENEGVFINKLKIEL